MPRDESQSLVQSSRALIRRVSQKLLPKSRQRLARSEQRLTTSIGLQLESTQRLWESYEPTLPDEGAANGADGTVDVPPPVTPSEDVP